MSPQRDGFMKQPVIYIHTNFGGVVKPYGSAEVVYTAQRYFILVLYIHAPYGGLTNLSFTVAYIVNLVDM